VRRAWGRKGRLAAGAEIGLLCEKKKGARGPEGRKTVSFSQSPCFSRRCQKGGEPELLCKGGKKKKGKGPILGPAQLRARAEKAKGSALLKGKKKVGKCLCCSEKKTKPGGSTQSRKKGDFRNCFKPH